MWHILTIVTNRRVHRESLTVNGLRYSILNLEE